MTLRDAWGDSAKELSARRHLHFFCIMLLFREIGGQDRGVSLWNSSLWVKNLVSWSKEHQEPPSEASIGIGKRKHQETECVSKHLFYFNNWFFCRG